jgi:hypothetical protein
MVMAAGLTIIGFALPARRDGAWRKRHNRLGWLAGWLAGWSGIA